MNRFDWRSITPGYAQGYDDFRGAYAPQTLSHIFNRAAPGKELPVILDLACGTGAVLREMFGRARLLVGADAAAPMLAQAQSLYLKRVPGLALVRTVGEQLPFAAGSVDLVTIGQAIHWFDLPKLFSELRRVLRPGGWLAVLSRYPSPAGRLSALTELIQYSFTEDGRRGIPKWSSMNAPANLLGLEKAGFIRYERSVFSHEMELTVEGYLQGVLDRGRRRSIPPEDLLTLQATLETALDRLASDGKLRETFFDYVFMAQKP